jgi:hypothetical protein
MTDKPKIFLKSIREPITSKKNSRTPAIRAIRREWWIRYQVGGITRKEKVGPDTLDLAKQLYMDAQHRVEAGPAGWSSYLGWMAAKEAFGMNVSPRRSFSLEVQ